MTETRRGRFIVFEGIDGSGKTTQAKAIAEWLPASGLLPEGKKVVLTREPGGTEIGQSIREIVLHGKAYLDPLAELLLFAADRAQHVATVIKPALERGDWVVCDRFTGSTIAYQGSGRRHNRNLIEQVNRISSGFSDRKIGVKPDLVLLLDLDHELAARRMSGGDRFESEKIEFIKRVRRGYIHQARRDDKDRTWMVIPAKYPMNKVTNNCIEAIKWAERQLLLRGH